MADVDQMDAVIAIASDPKQLQAAQHDAAQKLLNFDGEVYPSDGCAITLSTLLQEGGIAVPDTFKAIDLGRLLRDSRGWAVIPLGQQKAGDVGSTCGDAPKHGSDHIYLVLGAVNADELVIADNQSTAPHFRSISGHDGKTPTKFFLRAT